MVDIQKAFFWKRISAWLFDFILVIIVAVGFASLTSLIVDYDAKVDKLNASYEKYATMYGVDFNISSEDYEALTDAEKENYTNAYAALAEDEEAVFNFNVVMNLTILAISLGTFFGILVIEFIIPLIFKNGQTLGKKIFGIAVMQTNGVKVSNVTMFVRSILGKYTIEAMIPILLVLLIYFGSIGIVGTIVILLMGILQIVLLIATKTNSLIHDVLAYTVVVDMSSQKIFNNTSERDEFIREEAERKALRDSYYK